MAKRTGKQGKATGPTVIVAVAYKEGGGFEETVRVDNLRRPIPSESDADKRARTLRHVWAEKAMGEWASSVGTFEAVFSDGTRVAATRDEVWAVVRDAFNGAADTTAQDAPIVVRAPIVAAHDWATCGCDTCVAARDSARLAAQGANVAQLAQGETIAKLRTRRRKYQSLFVARLPSGSAEPPCIRDAIAALIAVRSCSSPARRQGSGSAMGAARLTQTTRSWRCSMRPVRRWPRRRRRVSWRRLAT